MRYRTFCKTLALLFFFFVMSFLLNSISSAKDSRVLYDDFDDNTTNTCLWTIYQRGAGPIIEEINQWLEITFPADSAGSWFGAEYISVFQLRGDFDIQVDYQLINWPTSNGVRVGINHCIVGETYFEQGCTGAVERSCFGSDIDFPGKPRDVYLTHFTDGIKGITATSDLAGKLRLVRLGNTVTGYYFNSEDWVPVHTASTTTDDVNIILSVWSHDYCFTDQSVKIAFDNFSVNDGQLIGGPCNGDFDTDGDVDGSDLAAFAANFGRTDCPICQ